MAPTDDALVLDADDVRALLRPDDCVPLLGRTLAALSAGEAVAPVRLVLGAADGAGDLALMPAHLGGRRTLGYKAVTVFPGARDHGQPSHQATVFLLDPDTGRLSAVLDGTTITSIRTAAVSALATDHLARADARVMALLGAGAQARAHLEAVPPVRGLTEVRVWGRRRQEAQRLVASAGLARPRVLVAESAREAVTDADVVIAATTATEPLFDHSWLATGAHVNAVGSCVPTAREVDAATVAAARIVVEDSAAARSEAGDLLLAEAEGVPLRIDAELGDVVAGRTTGRESDDQLTLFESLGVGVEDVAVAAHVVALAREQGRGARLRLA